jgi:hypothetical protein
MGGSGKGHSKGSGSGSKGVSAQANPTMPIHRQGPPAGYGQGIDYHGAAATVPDEVPHMSRLANTPNAWVWNGEMLLVKWPVEFSMSKAFPPPGSADCLMELHDELAVQGATFSMRSQRKRKQSDEVTFQRLRIVGPPGSVVQIYRRLRLVAGKCMHSFKGLPPVNRPRVFAVNDKGWDYDKKGYLKESLRDMDDTGADPDDFDDYSDDEYVEIQTQSIDYRQSMQQSLAVGELDVLQSNRELTTGRKTHGHDGVGDIQPMLQNPMDELLAYLLRLARQYTAAAPGCCGNIPPKQWMNEQLDAAEARGSEMIHVGAFAELFVVSISTNMKRNKQCIVAHLFNLVTSFVYFLHIRFVLTSFGDDAEDVNLLRIIFAPVVQWGILIIASGGVAGVTMHEKSGWLDKPAWMPSLPDNVCHPGQQLMPFQRYWHSSLCKNASHMVAKYKFDKTANLFINTDCDNFWPTAYLESVWAIFQKNENAKGLCIFPHGNVDGGTTGRLVYRPVDFWAIGGYDESLSPAGGQDVQLRLRLGMYGMALGTGKQDFKIKNYQMVGGCFPNDFDNTTMKHDRGLAKTVNIDPGLLAALPGPEYKKWHKMNALNWQENVAPRITAKQWLCNGDMRNGKTELGCWWNAFPTNSIVAPDPVEGITPSAWPYIAQQSVPTSGGASSSAPHAGTSEAVPSVPAPAGSATTSVDVMAGLPRSDNKKKLMVNIYVVGIARLTEFSRDEHTCPVAEGSVNLARASIAVHSAWQMIDGQAPSIFCLERRTCFFPLPEARVLYCCSVLELHSHAGTP